MHFVPTSSIRSDKVELFPLEPNNVTDTYIHWLNDPEINRYLESRFQTHTHVSTRQFVERCIACPATLLVGIRSIELKRRHVGNIKIGNIDKYHGIGEIGILLGEKSAWGKGIASETISLIITIARDQLGLRKLTAGCYASNIGSQKAFQRAGFVIAGERKDHFLLDGKPETYILLDCFLK